jgi:hypothetical protein
MEALSDGVIAIMKKTLEPNCDRWHSLLDSSNLNSKTEMLFFFTLDERTP